MSYQYEATTKDVGDGWVEVSLVPIEIFGIGCLHCDTDTFTCPECGDQGHHGFGLSDAVSWWGDCNRAEGHMLRFEDIDGANREPGETLTVRVKRDELEAFMARGWGEARNPEANKLHVVTEHSAIRTSHKR